MILKFNHISYSCSDELDAVRHTPVHYTESFRDVGLDNISCKMKYLKFKSIKHNIIMLVSNASDSLGADRNYAISGGRSRRSKPLLQG